MSTYKKRLENTQDRQRRQRAERKQAIATTAGVVLVGPVANALVLDSIQLGPLSGRQISGLAGVFLAFSKFGRKPAGRVGAAAGQFSAGLEVYERMKAFGTFQNIFAGVFGS